MFKGFITASFAAFVAVVITASAQANSNLPETYQGLVSKADAKQEKVTNNSKDSKPSVVKQAGKKDEKAPFGYHPSGRRYAGDKYATSSSKGWSGYTSMAVFGDCIRLSDNTCHPESTGSGLIYYINRIRERSYLRLASTLDIYDQHRGKARICFTVQRDGTITDAYLEKGTGRERTDRKIIDAFTYSKFPPVPEKIKNVPIAFCAGSNTYTK